MNLRQLRYFYDTAQNQNLAKTAEKHMVPASAVSSSIKRLEQELGIELFDRSANRITLNFKGKILANELQTTFDTLDNALEKITTLDVEKPEIRILVQARPKWIAELIIEYMSQNPEVKFTISNDYTLTNFDGFDLIIAEQSTRFSNWQGFLLSAEILCIKAAADSPLLNQEFTFKQLKKEPFILQSKGNGMRDRYERLCQKYGITPNVVVECNDRQLLQYYVESGLGLTIGAYRALGDSTQNAIAPLTVVDFNETQHVYVYYRATRYNSPALKMFRDFLFARRHLI